MAVGGTKGQTNMNMNMNMNMNISASYMALT